MKAVILTSGSSFIIGILLGRFFIATPTAASPKPIISSKASVQNIVSLKNLSLVHKNDENTKEELDSIKKQLLESSLDCELRIIAAGGIEPIPWTDSTGQEMESEIEEILSKCPNLLPFLGTSIEIECSENPCAVFALGENAIGALDSCKQWSSFKYSSNHGTSLEGKSFGPKGEMSSAYVGMDEDHEDYQEMLDRRRLRERAALEFMSEK